MLEIEAPYTIEQLMKMKKLLVKTIVWDGFNMRWVLEECRLYLIVRGNAVITILPFDETPDQKPVSEFAKKFGKKRERMGKRRNAKSNKNWRM